MEQHAWEILRSPAWADLQPITEPKTSETRTLVRKQRKRRSLKGTVEGPSSV